MSGKKHLEVHLAEVVNAQTNPNVTQRVGWNYIKNALTRTTKTYAISSFTKTKYIKKYNEKKVKDKNGKETTKKEPVYDYRYNYPWTVTGHQFSLKIPQIHHVKRINFRVTMKVDKGVTATVPTARFCIYGGSSAKHYNETDKAVTGWRDGLYYYYPNSDISTSWQTYTYTLDEDEIAKGNFTNSSYNSSAMGIDLIFGEPEIKQEITASKGTISKHIYLAWIECDIEYYTPTYRVTYKDDTRLTGDTTGAFATNGRLLSSVLAKQIYTGDVVTVTAEFLRTIDNTSTQVLDVKLPDGMEIVGTPSTENSSFDKDTMKWTVSCKRPRPITLTMKVKSHRSGLNVINISNNNVGSFDYKLNVNRGQFDGYENISVTFINTPHKNHRQCILLSIHGYVEGHSIGDDESYAQITYNLSSDKLISDGEWSKYLSDVDDGVTIVSQTENTVTIQVPNNSEFDTNLCYCFYPKDSGEYTFVITSDIGDRTSFRFDVKDPYVYHITSDLKDNDDVDYYYSMKSDIVDMTDYRILTSMDIDTVSIPSIANNRDSHMVQSNATLVMHKQDELDYIGCVPLEHLHFDPKSTYKDTLLDSRYKNKRYMGKKLASDEDITLNVRLHPMQVTTIQGLIDMDKPIPINANHKCFESDALNHRGWAEIYSIKAEETNPHWYKCDIDVKYLTHNLNTRFKIDKGIKVTKYDTPMLMAETVESGTKLYASSDELDEDTLFYVDTDGTYSYSTDESLNIDYLDENYNTVINQGDNTTLTYTDEDEEEPVTITGLDNVVEYIHRQGYVVATPILNEPIQVVETIETPNNQRNSFTLDEGQHIFVKTRDPLANQSIVRFEWLSSFLDEDKENNISRIIRLVDVKGEPIFEYEYTDFTFDDDNISCETIARWRTDGGWETRNGFDVDMRMYSPLSNEENEDDSVVDNTTLQLLYGSTLQLTLDNKSLTLIDEGFNSMEFTLGSDDDKVNLISDTYHWETEWINNNQDGETDDVVCFFDVTIASTILTSQYGDKYDKLYVSPFPVKDKKLLFTREAEEGTIYYFEDDGDEFSYVMNPYYQYMNGTDLQYNGSSIFNLNYGYEVVYIQNGLVRLGFNRLTGRLYLGKYDISTREYIDTHRFHLKKYDDINVNSISDDKIEIQASDSVFTIWRGHPYIMIKHNNESIFIDSNFNRVWAEQVNNDVVELPSNWFLLNDKNLLSACVGGTDTIKASCLTGGEVEIPNKNSSSLNWRKIVWVNGENTGYYTSFSDAQFLTDVDYYFLIEGKTSTVNDRVPLIDYTGNLGTYTSNVSVNVTEPFKLYGFSDKDIIQTGDVINLNGRLVNADDDGIEGRTVYFYELYEPSINITGDKSIIQTGESVDVSAKLKDEDGSLIEGETVYFYEQYETSSYWELLAEQTQTYNDGQNVTVISPVLSRSEIGSSWKLSFDLKATVEGRIFIGSNSYAVPTNPQYSIFMGRDVSNLIAYGVRTTSTSVSSSSISSTEYQHCTIEFNNGTITYYVDNNVIGTKSVGFYENYDEYVIGLVAWTNGGGVFNVKNIILEDLE